MTAESGTGLLLAVADIELSDLFGVSPICVISLDIHLPLPAESIEVIDERSSEEGLQSVINILQRHALLERFVPIDFNVDLRDVGKQCGCDSSEFRPFASGREEGIDVLREVLNASIAAILKDKGDSPGDARAPEWPAAKKQTPWLQGAGSERGLICPSTLDIVRPVFCDPPKDSR